MTPLPALKAGIIDPTKVVRTALQDAASVAGLVITTEAMVASKPEPTTVRCPCHPAERTIECERARASCEITSLRKASVTEAPHQRDAGR